MSSYSNPLTEYSPQMEFAADSAEYGMIEAKEAALDAREMELAVGLLEVNSEGELEEYLGSLVNAAGQVHQSEMGTPVAGAAINLLKRLLQRFARRPAHGHGTFHAVGRQIGHGISAVAGPMLGLELEGLSPEDREFEAARQFVRFATQLVKNASDRDGGLHSEAAVHEAAQEAAQTYAPGLAIHEGHAPADRGRWICRNGKIILYGA